MRLKYYCNYFNEYVNEKRCMICSVSNRKFGECEKINKKEKQNENLCKQNRQA